MFHNKLNDNNIKQDVMKKKHCIVVDSRNRNTTIFPNSNHFEFKFNPGNSYIGPALYKNFKNILEIKLIQCILPRFFVTDNSTPYLILEIPELNDNIIGTNQNLSKAFTILIPNRLLSDSNFVNCRVDNMSYCFKQFNPPINTLHKMTIKFNKPDGSLYNHSSFLGNSDENQILLIFEITTIEMNRNILNSHIIRPTQ